MEISLKTLIGILAGVLLFWRFVKPLPEPPEHDSVEQMANDLITSWDVGFPGCLLVILLGAVAIYCLTGPGAVFGTR